MAHSTIYFTVHTTSAAVFNMSEGLQQIKITSFYMPYISTNSLVSEITLVDDDK